MKRLSKRLAAFAAAGLVLAAGPALAEKVYRWVDKDGTVRYTKSEPAMGTPYDTIEMPDPVRWYNAPAMPVEYAPANGQTPQNFFKSVSKSVYALVGGAADDSGGRHQVKFGSAVAVSEKIAITNCHILQDAGDDIYLGSGASDEVEKATLVGANYELDRCVVSVSRMDLQPVPGLRRFDDVEVGETVYAIGNPLRLDRTLSEGLVSGKRERSDRRYLQTTAPISPGSSGGGLFDAHGNLLGITSFTMKGAQGLNFAIPAEDYWK
jgi:S1-C subfamily serine protease